MTRRIYPKPPIVEAVIEFHFQVTTDANELAHALGSALAHRYDADVRQHDLFEISASDAGGGVSTSARRVPHMFFLRSASGLRQLGCGRSALSVHTLAPYPGWESFLEQAYEAVGVLPELVRQAPINRIAIRYLDLLRLPPREELINFITVVPSPPDGMPSLLTNYHYFTQSQDQDDHTVVQLTVTNAPDAGASGPGLLYDLALVRSGDPLSSFDSEHWVPHVESMHTRLRHIFESSITDKTRELFQ